MDFAIGFASSRIKDFNQNLEYLVDSALKYARRPMDSYETAEENADRLQMANELETTVNLFKVTANSMLIFLETNNDQCHIPGNAEYAETLRKRERLVNHRQLLIRCVGMASDIDDLINKCTYTTFEVNAVMALVNNYIDHVYVQYLDHLNNINKEFPENSTEKEE